jgi:alanine racemase
VASWVGIDEERLAANYAALKQATQPALPADNGAGSQAGVADGHVACVAMLAVVKSDAYGHGAERCAVALARAGAPWLGVADAAEGARVRSALLRAGMECSMPGLLVMCGLLEQEAMLVVRECLVPVVWTAEHIAWLARAVRSEAAERLAQNPLGLDAQRASTSRLRAELAAVDALCMQATAAAVAARDSACTVHIEIDTGMTRQGCAPGTELDALLDLLARTSELRLGGVLTHLASAEIVGSPQTVAQRGLFEQAVEQIRVRGLQPDWVHVGNSSFLDVAGNATEDASEDRPSPPRDRLTSRARRSGVAWLAEQAARLHARPMSRAGLALYGYCLPLTQPGGQSAVHHIAALSNADDLYATMQTDAPDGRVRPFVKPVMLWTTRIASLREVGAGIAVGYNGTFVTKKPMRLALLPVGYADGLRRGLSAPPPSRRDMPVDDGEIGGWVIVHGMRAPIVGRISMNLTVVDVTAIAEAAVGDEALLLGDGITAEEHALLAGVSVYEVLCGVRGRFV